MSRAFDRFRAFGALGDGELTWAAQGRRRYIAFCAAFGFDGG
jgi:hypothetical protein